MFLCKMILTVITIIINLIDDRFFCFVFRPNGKTNEKEIYMYDVMHNQVNKLSGDLSTTFVDVAESNSHSHDLDNLSSDEEVDVVVSGTSANDGTPGVVSGYDKTMNISGSIVATANN